MSDQHTLVSARHFAYLAERTRADDAFLRALKQAAAEAGIPRIWISPAQASFMQVLLKLRRARDVLEVGTLAGYSAIAMARALPAEGRVTTVESEPRHADFAEAQIARSDVAGRVSVLRGRGQDVLPGLPDASFDAVFLDADKSGYATYLQESLRLLRPGGLLLVDNAFAFGELFADAPRDPETAAVRAFNEILAAEPRIHGVIVPMGDGLWVGVLED